MAHLKRLHVLMVIIMISGLLSVIPVSHASASCFGDGCRRLDPNQQGCAVNVTTGQSRNITVWPWPVMTIEVRKSSACGGVKWARASRDVSYTGGTFKVWLADSNGNQLDRTDYTAPTPSDTQIYGNMWTGGVKACALLTTYSSTPQCTGLDN
jgi:hypothetical protein